MTDRPGLKSFPAKQWEWNVFGDTNVVKADDAICEIERLEARIREVETRLNEQPNAEAAL